MIFGMDAFLLRAALAGVGVALAAAPLGCFVVWRRMAYFGDATAHASVLGVALALAFSLPVFWGALLVALGMASLVSALSNRGQSMDTMLGVISHSALAIGLVAVSFLPSVRLDLLAYLFGDILAVGWDDIGLIWCGAGIVVGLLSMRWNALLTATLNPDLARSVGIDPAREQLVLTLALATTVAVAIKVVGVLLIVALLIIPAATARRLARSPEAMAAYAAAVGCISALGGLWASFIFDTPTGPSIVACSTLLFVLATGLVRRPA